jgi:hypothetical protein
VEFFPPVLLSTSRSADLSLPSVSTHHDRGFTKQKPHIHHARRIHAVMRHTVPLFTIDSHHSSKRTRGRPTDLAARRTSSVVWSSLASNEGAVHRHAGSNPGDRRESIIRDLYDTLRPYFTDLRAAFKRPASNATTRRVTYNATASTSQITRKAQALQTTIEFSQNGR